LLHLGKLSHSYPHCWRHKTPIIFRATPQWFISMDQAGLRAQALKEIEKVDWVPEWGESRITNMIETRPDWCISRQRTWTMPITSYIHKETGDLHPDTQRIMATVADAIEQKGMEAWYEFDDETLIGKDTDQYHKIKDGLDVWFDSGVTHACVLAVRPGLHVPADLYLEGSDQHRGWFQSSLLTSVAMNGQAPYKQVVTHGFTVDKDGRKMSKSIGNTVAPQQVINRLGADVLRLWVASIDFRNDQVVSDEIFDRTADAYRRIRNTARFLLANLNGFDPSSDLINPGEMVALDRYIVRRALALQETIVEAYEKMQFHHIYQIIHNFCSVDLGSFYLDIIKDRQYTAKAHTPAHQSAQTAMYYLIEMLVRWLAPLIPFTAEEIWEHIPGERDESVFLVHWYADIPVDLQDDQLTNDCWRELMRVRDEVNKALEKARAESKIGSGLDANVVLFADHALYPRLELLKDELRFVLITSGARLGKMSERSATSVLTDLEGLAVEVQVSTAQKCARCWQHREDVGSDAAHPELCGRCVVNVDGEGEVRAYA
jgi:isoleucyl-tRNA synthetase